MKTIGVPQPQGGKKVDPWKPNKEVCPDYPYRTHYNEAGEIVFSIPMDVMNDIPVDDEDDEKYSYSFLPIPGGKAKRVWCYETTDRAIAFELRRDENTTHTQDRRHEEREHATDEIKGDGESIATRGYTGPAREPQVEKFVLDKIEREELKVKMEAKDPRVWLVFSRKYYEGEDVSALMKELDLSQPRIYQLLNKGKQIAAQHRNED